VDLLSNVATCLIGLFLAACWHYMQQSYQIGIVHLIQALPHRFRQGLPTWFPTALQGMWLIPCAPESLVAPPNPQRGALSPSMTVGDPDGIRLFSQ
jgi:hypothetical protein